MFFPVARLRLSLVSALLLFSSLSRAHERTLFTSSVSYCSDPQEILVEQFNIAYFPSNNSISFNVSAASVLADLNVTAQLYVNIYGMHPINTTLNFCSLFNGILCPLPQYNFTGWDTLQLPSSVVGSITSHLPGIAYVIPDLEAFAQLTLYKENTDQVVACLQTTVSNGWSARQYAVEWTTAAVTFLALASAIWKSITADALALAPIRLLDFVVLLQTIGATGLLGLNFPSVYTAFTLNFSWILGLFPQSGTSGMQNSIVHTRRLTGGDSSDASSGDSTAYVNRQLSPYNMLAQPASLLESVRTLPTLDLRNTAARSLMKVGTTAVNTTSRLLKSAQADVAVVTNDDSSDVLQAGVPIYVNSIGIASANAFMTVFLTALIYTAAALGFIGIAFALYVGIQRTAWGQRNLKQWIGLRSGFVPFAKAWGLRAVLAAVFPLLIFIFYQWTLHDSWLSILLSVITLVILMGLVLPPLFLVLRPYLPRVLARTENAAVPTSLPLAPLTAPFRQERLFYVGLIVLTLIVKAMVVAFGHRDGLGQAIVFLIVDVLFFLSLVIMKPFRTRHADMLQGYLAIVRMVCSGLLIAFVQTINLAPIPRVVIGVITAVIFAVAVIVMFFNTLVNMGLWKLFKYAVCCGHRRREGDRALASHTSDSSLDDKAHPERDAEKAPLPHSPGSSQYYFVDRPGNPTPPETRTNSHAHTHLDTPDSGSPLSTSVGSERPSVLTNSTGTTLGELLPRRWSFQHSRPPSASEPSPSGAGSFLTPSTPSTPASTHPPTSQRHSRHPSASVATHSPIRERYSDEQEAHAL
ncbi:TRP-domain-containing protein [Rhodofomes roseus]|uniref:TRP-domain-containing protein n=1 Tax=Rhodofomes roseus TaxID=34475 RepID=A0ABQ8KMK0_9APHY|nr:TRP-domain-containing protein [Rhodofomes roseus]KAH9839554.1 TRP-domain-containing protein [Rhodofomes roseus]